MKTTSELLLTFLLNACWQVAVVGAAAMLGDLFLRRTVASYRHLLWIVALAISIVIPLFPSLSLLRGLFVVTPAPAISIQPLTFADGPATIGEAISASKSSAYNINQTVALTVLALYALFIVYRIIKLVRAGIRTRVIMRETKPLELSHEVQGIVAKCERAIGVKAVTFLSSSSLQVPATLGIFRPWVILPEGLLHESQSDALTAAIGHELVHVARRDYLLNLICEFIFLPLSFHPAAALMRRRITQTRELRCDELVTELLLRPEVYARSLVQLARSAMPFARRTRTVAVGIADADILEVRIMSLLKGTK